MSDNFTHYLPPEKCFLISERFLTDLNIPPLKSEDYELHFIENGAGIKRIVGDSAEFIDNYDLILVHGNGIDHSWEAASCESKLIRDVVIWFSSDLLSQTLLNMEEFHSLKKMLFKASQGICFPLSAIMKVYSQIDGLPSEENGFGQYYKLIKLLYDLSECDGLRTLANSSINDSKNGNGDPRISIVKDFVKEHFIESVTLPQLSEMAHMTPVSFSRFFKQQTGKNISDYIIDVRLHYASQMLLESTESISEICFGCGFNNLSNFNRLFKKKKGITPKMFRSHYRKDKYTL